MKQLTPTELRIGNYILDDENDIVKVACLQSDLYHKEHDIDGGKIMFEKNGDIMFADFVLGVELSSDILIKAGFETNHWGTITTIEKNITEDVYFTLNNTYPEVVLYVNRQEVIRVTYLHQLQNLYFALTGTELNITL